MVHNHCLEEAKKKTQKRGRNSRPSVMPSAGSQSTANGNKPKPRINKQTSKNWPASKTSCVTTKTVPIAEHSRNSRKFSDSKHFVCSTCQKRVFNANHDSCITKFLNEVNSRAKVPYYKTTNRNKPVEQIFTSSTTTVDSEPPHGFNTDITNLHECIQTLDSRAGTSINVQEEQNLDLSIGTNDGVAASLQQSRIHYHMLILKLQRHTLSIKNQESRIKKAQVLKIKTSVNSDKQDLPLRYQVYQGRLLASFQDDAKYDHVGQDTRSQDGKDDQDIQGKDLKISEQNTKSKDNDKGLRLKITQHEGTSLQQDKDQDKDSRTQRHSNLNKV
ncbi:hypothetical protein Tco_1076180 [Tanacetum coccineum]